MTVPRASRDHEPWIDAVRSIAIILVVTIHCSTGYFREPSESVPGWLFACFVHVSSQIAVPLFFMVSGYLLYKPGIDPGLFFRRRLRRLMIPLITWSIIYVVFRVHWQEVV